jgi:hypothetical protein
VTLKTLVTGVAAVAVVGAAAAGVTSIASGASVASVPAVQPVVFDIPLPLDNPSDLDLQLQGVLTDLATPGVSFRDPSKMNRIQNGVGLIEGRTADRLLANAVAAGKLPLAISVTDAVQTGNTATANVTASGPQTPPVTQSVTFVNEGGWKVSRASATSFMAAVAG